MAPRTRTGSKKDDRQAERFPFVVTTSSAKPDLATRKMVRQYAIRGAAKARRESNTYGKRNMLQYPPTPILQAPMRSLDKHDLDISTDRKECAASCVVLPQRTLEMHDDEREIHKHMTVSPLRAFFTHNNRPLIERLGAGRHDPFVAYPVEITEQRQRILDCVFDSRVGTLKPYRDAYYFIARDDASAFHQFLANAALHRTLYISEGKILRSHEATAFHYKALQLANRKIGNIEERVSDGMIATALIMAAYNHILLDLEAWNMHMDGIEKILNLRGGIETLNSNMRLRLLVSWLDVTGSCSLDRMPRFPLPNQYAPELPNLDDYRSPFAQYLRGMWQICYPNHPEISCLMDDLRVFNSLLGAEATWSTGRIWADGIVSGFWLNHIVRQSLCLQAAVDLNDAGSVICEAFRLGVLLYLAEIRRQFGVYPVVMHIHVSKVKALLKYSDVSWRSFLPLKIWVVAMALIEANTSQDKYWFAYEINSLAQDLNLGSGENLEDLLKQLFWYPQVHSVLLWTKIRALNLFAS
ncbi:hypothetical protein BKA61DRAFT_605001 [Leptodontidium sp. MPI-SDFR-AT-0119]|nr:hypothetical protein BKA61DRAFT_605001 [Leptodontidium sp. MPI-SDFR-AT-0119]